MKNPATVILVLVLGPMLSTNPAYSISTLRPKYKEFIANEIAHDNRFIKLYNEQVKAGTLKGTDIMPYREAGKVLAECAKKERGAVETKHKEYYAKLEALNREAGNIVYAGAYCCAELSRLAAIINDADLLKEYQQIGDEQMKATQDCKVVYENYLKNYKQLWNLYEQSRNA